MKNLIEVIAVSDKSIPNVEFTLDVATLKKVAVSQKTFENPKNGTRNYPESYMKKNAGIRVVNNNEKFEMWQVGNHDSFFSTHKIFDLTKDKIELPYILGMQIKNKFVIK